MNIVYATDDNGALGTGVNIVSLMENLPPGVHADIYIMTGGLSGDNTARFHSLQQGYNLHLHFIDMKVNIRISPSVPNGRRRRITVLASQGNFPPR